MSDNVQNTGQAMAAPAPANQPLVGGYLSDAYLSSLARQIPPEKKVQLGLVLGFTNPEISAYANDHPSHWGQTFQMLVDWRCRQEGDGPTNVRALGQCLANGDVGLGQLKTTLYGDHNIQD